MRDVGTHIIELLAIADICQSRCLSRKCAFRILHFHPIDGKIIAINAILQIAYYSGPHTIIGLSELQGFAPRHGIAAEAYLLGIRGIDTESHITITQIANRL